MINAFTGGLIDVAIGSTNLNGLWSFHFETGLTRSVGICTFDDFLITGGDSEFVYRGYYKIQDDIFSGTFEIARHSHTKEGKSIFSSHIEKIGNGTTIEFASDPLSNLCEKSLFDLRGKCTEKYDITFLCELKCHHRTQ